MKPYIHRIWRTDSDDNLSPESIVIKTKKKFRQEMIRHFFDEEGFPLVFQLVESPNANYYRIRPYLNRQGKPAIGFSLFNSTGKSTPEEILF